MCEVLTASLRRRQQRAPSDCCQLMSVQQMNSCRLAVVTENMTTHCRLSDHRTGDQGTALSFNEISPQPTTTTLHPPTQPPSTPLHSSPTVMAHPAHLLMNQYASTDSFKREGTAEIRFPVGARRQCSCMLALLMIVVCVCV